MRSFPNERRLRECRGWGVGRRHPLPQHLQLIAQLSHSRPPSLLLGPPSFCVQRMARPPPPLPLGKEDMSCQ